MYKVCNLYSLVTIRIETWHVIWHLNFDLATYIWLYKMIYVPNVNNDIDMQFFHYTT